VNLNVHYHLVIPDGVFVDDDHGGLAFVLHPVPRGADVIPILDRIVRRVMRRLADEAVVDPDESIDPTPDLFAQVQVEAATTWRAPSVASAPMRGSEYLRAWHVTSPSRSLHAGVGIAEHDRDALERLCRYGARPAFAQDRLAWTDDGGITDLRGRRCSFGPVKLPATPNAA